MPEPSLIVVAMQAAVRAAVGAAAKPTTKATHKFLQKLRRDPAILKRFETWRETSLTMEQQRAIARFLNTRECQGLLEMYAFVEYDSAAYWRTQVDELRKAFSEEARRDLTLPDHLLQQISSDLWLFTTSAIRLEVERTRQGVGSTSASTLYAQSLLNSALFPGSDYLRQSVSNRTGITKQLERSVEAHQLIGRIKAATRSAYSTIEMPHAKENYRAPIEQIYMPRYLSSERRISSFDPDSDIDSSMLIADSKLTNNERRLIILGSPGAGKTTYVNSLMYRLSKRESEIATQAPMLVQLKNYSRWHADLVEAITQGLRTLLQDQAKEQTVRDILALGCATVIFDGLDEVGDIVERRSVAAEVENFCGQYPLTQVIVTARRDGYVAAPLNRELFASFFLPEFTDAQVQDYVYRWFKFSGRNSSTSSSKMRAASFMRESGHIVDIRSNPLMLSLLCFLYEYEQWIPENRLQVYEECAILLFEKWDRIRFVPVRRVGGRQIWFLFQELANWFYFHRGAGPASESRVKDVITRFIARIEGVDDGISYAAEASELLDFCSQRAWLLTRVGSTERGERVFDFTHRTFMEYFTACYVARQSSDATELVESVSKVVSVNGSFIVAQIAIQQYDVRSANGLGQTIDQLLRGDQLAPVMRLDFLLDFLKYVQPGHAQLHEIFRDALVFAAAERNDFILDRIIRVPPAVMHELQVLCDSLVDDNNPDLVVGGAIGQLAISSAESFFSGSSPEFSLFTDRKISSGHRRHLVEIGHKRAYAVACLYYSEFIDLRTYVECNREPVLVTVPHGPRLSFMAECKAPLFSELHWAKAPSSDLLYALDKVAITPWVVAPMSIEAASKLAAVVSHSHNYVSKVPFEMRKGLYALCIVLVCIMFDEGRDWKPLMMLLVDWDVVRGRVLTGGKSSRVELGSYIFASVTRLLAQSEWTSVISDWRAGNVSFTAR